MDVFSILFITALVIFTIALILMLKSDGDLTLMYAENFGTPTDKLSGKVVWITGASSGIGEYLAYELASINCRLVLSARRIEELERVKKKCLDVGKLSENEVLVLPMDVTAFSEHEKCFNIVMEHFKDLDILVNNAGGSQRADWENIKTDVDSEMFKLNVFAPVSLSRIAVKHFLKKKGGHIAVTSSVTGKIGAPYSATYTGTKFAIQGYFESLKLEKITDNIDVSIFSVGKVHTNLLQNAFTEESGKVYGKAWSKEDVRMAPERCAHLFAVALANKLFEVWITDNPILLFMYIHQYCPSLFIWFYKLMHNRIIKLRDGTATNS